VQTSRAIAELEKELMDSSEPDIGLLVERVRDGDNEAWVALTDRYTNLLWSIARGLRLSDADAADAIQTTWLRLVERLDSVREPERLGSWLATTMRRECLAGLKRNARMQVTASEDWDEIPATADPLDAALLREERDAALWRAFAALRPRCRTLLRVLMADPAPSYVEVASALNMPVGSIGPTRRRCLELLRQIMLTGAQFGLPSPGNA
jgi:RNA polymerase sigma factor (sigma-70 family)